MYICPMHAEIVTIGDELLLGQTIDTNSAWLGGELAKIGIEILRKTAIKDRKQDIIDGLHEAMSRSNLVLITGGLGPTKDDITKHTLAAFFNSKLVRNEQVLKHLEQIFENRGREILETNKMQADVPEICTVLHNAIGTAPGMWFEKDNCIVISMPGVPNEMKGIFENEALPRIKEFFTLPAIAHKTCVVVGVPESILSKQLEPFEMGLPPYIKLAYLPDFNLIRLLLIGKYDKADKLEIEMDQFFEKLCLECQIYLVAKQDIKPMTALCKWLIDKKLSISAAESCTGGFVAASMVATPGISSIYSGSINTYSNQAKHRELGVDNELFGTVGAVSKECAAQMAEGVRTKFGVELGISTTGIAGPAGATDSKKVGLVYMAISNGKHTEVHKFHLMGNRQQFIERSVGAMCSVLSQFLKAHYSYEP